MVSLGNFAVEMVFSHIKIFENSCSFEKFYNNFWGGVSGDGPMTLQIET